MPQDISQDAVHAVRVTTVLGVAVVAVLVAATEAFAEVVLIFVYINVVAIVPVGRVLIGVRVLIAASPTIRSIRLPGAIALRVAVVDGLPEHLRAVPVRLVVSAATVVAIV